MFLVRYHYRWVIHKIVMYWLDFDWPQHQDNIIAVMCKMLTLVEEALTLKQD